MMKTMAFVDYENIWTGLAERGVRLTPENLVSSIEQYTVRTGEDLRAIYLYANFDREEFWRAQTEFEKTNVFTRHVYGKNNYANTELRQNAADVELMLEAQEILLTRPATIDLFILFTGDADFLPLIRKIRAWGKEVKVIGVDGSIHHTLQPYCDSSGMFQDVVGQGMDKEYDPEQDVLQGIQILGQMQIRLPYVASTKARVTLGEQLGRTAVQVKDLIRYMLREKILIEKEYPDASLKIGRTKIYLLNLEQAEVIQVLDSKIQEIQQRYVKVLADLDAATH